MDFASLDTADFGNAGSAQISIGSYGQPSPEVLTVEVTPDTTGTLRFQINQGADIRDTENQSLDTTAAIPDDTSLNVTEPPTSGDSFDDWADGFPGLTDRNPVLDFDNGGLATAIEWVLGGDPTDPSDDASLAPTIDNKTDPNGKLIFTYRRRIEARDDDQTTIVVQYGNTLAGWSPAAHQGNGPDQITISSMPDPEDAGFELVTVALPPSLTDTNSMFVRLSVAVCGNPP
jgi:hypothetical protein